MDLQTVLGMVFSGVGGLGIFLLGMFNMSQGMQAVAGDGLRRIISAVTDNRLMATGAGMLVTCLVQSSSVTTVMVVGFVNSRFMTLSQAIGVIMGANIGTTITGWLLVLDIGKYGLPVLGVAAFVHLFSKGDRWRFLGMAVMGVGMVFFGLELMKDACSQVQELPSFEAWFQRFRADTYLGVMSCAAVGCIVTCVVQSSSAMLGVTISLAATGVIPFETAAALVLGENIGTTITAVLASLGATTNARRASYFHVIFNLVGVFWVTLIFDWYLEAVRFLVDSLHLTQGAIEAQVLSGGRVTYPYTTPAIAITHSAFNIANTLLFMPWVNQMSRLLQRIVPEPKAKEKPHLEMLEARMFETPVLAIEQSRVEVVRMADGCDKMMVWLRSQLTSEEADQELVRKLFHREEVLDTIQQEIVNFITDLLSSDAPHRVAEEGRAQLRIADEYESISDYIASILKSHLKLRKQGHQFDEKLLRNLHRLHDKVTDHLALVSRGVRGKQRETITKASSIGDEIKHLVRDMREEHLQKLSTERVDPHQSLAYTAALNSYRRVRDHALNIAEALAGPK